MASFPLNATLNIPETGRAYIIIELPPDIALSASASMSLKTVDGPAILAELWNKQAHPRLPRVKHMRPSSRRFKAAVRRWKEQPDRTFWFNVIEKINSTPFLVGQNDRGWNASFDFVMKPDKAQEILEGVYSGTGFKSSQQSISDERWAMIKGDQDGRPPKVLDDRGGILPESGV